jgi:hypothetical protein
LLPAVVLLFSFFSYASELDPTVHLGNLVYEQTQSNQKFDKRALKNIKEVEEILAPHKCSGLTYNYYSVDASDKTYLYIIASKGNHVIAGRHFRFDMLDNTASLNSVIKSTTSCLDLGKPDKMAAGMYLSHLKEYPNEFHVLQSTIHNMPLFVGTFAGDYKVTADNIELIKER